MKAESALRTEVMRLCDRLSDVKFGNDERVDGIALRRLCDRSSEVSESSGSEGSEMSVVRWRQRCLKFGKRG